MTVIDMKHARPELILNGKKIEKYEAIHQVDINAMVSRWIIDTEEKPVKEVEPVLTEEEMRRIAHEEEIKENIVSFKQAEKLSFLKQETFENMCEWVNSCYKNEMASPGYGYVTINTIEATKLILESTRKYLSFIR